MCELLTAREVASRLKVSVRQCWKLAASGRLPQPLKLGRSVRWRADDLAAFVACDCDMQRFEAEASQ